MIFASDLDGTLIYSQRYLRNEQSALDLRSVEVINGRDITFMTEKAIGLLRMLSKEMLFVPVTSRSVEQYNRISLFKGDITPKYVVACNGGVVLQDGQVDKYWQRKMEIKLGNSAITVEDVKRKVEETSDLHWLESIRTVSGFFVYLTIRPELTPNKVLADYAHWAKENDLVFSVQGRRVYFIPSFVNKWDAVKYIVDKEGIQTILSAGDSHLDVCLLEQSYLGLIPRHGEAAEHNTHLEITLKTGILASEEIIETILSKQRT